MTSSIRDLKVYTTYPHSCSYLEDQEATTLFVDPRQRVDKKLYSRLSVLGFRRSGNHIYRPHCSQCNACIPARIPVSQFEPRRGQRKVWRRNADLRVTETAHILDDEAEARTMSRQARACVEEHYDVKQTYGRLAREMGEWNERHSVA